MHKIFNAINKLILRRLAYILFSIIFLLCSCIFFFWGHPIKWNDPNYILDNVLFGTLGDFIGGVLGTIFALISVLLVVKTFKYQRQVTNNDQELSQTEQFNNLFFELLHLYQSEVNELYGHNEVITNIQKTKDGKYIISKEDSLYNSKDFFDIEKEIIQKKYRNLKSYEKNRVRSLQYYKLFYIQNRSKIAVYFKTLYRIYELIDKSTLINEKQRIEYSKIIRAQLTESELFFIRYNGLTPYGEPFITYLNKYNVLKHLPTFELLEFKDWWGNMNNIEKGSIKPIYYLIKKKVKDVVNNKSSHTTKVSILPDEGTKYHISLHLIGLYAFSIHLTINNENDTIINEYLGINKLSEKRIQQLLDCFIKEIFIYSNYNRFNNSSEIITYSSPITYIDNQIFVDSGIKDNRLKPLKIRYQDDNHDNSHE